MFLFFSILWYLFIIFYTSLFLLFFFAHFPVLSWMDGHIRGDIVLALLACGKKRGSPLPQVKGNKIAFHIYKEMVSV